MRQAFERVAEALILAIATKVILDGMDRRQARKEAKPDPTPGQQHLDIATQAINYLEEHPDTEHRAPILASARQAIRVLRKGGWEGCAHELETRLEECAREEE